MRWPWSARGEHSHTEALHAIECAQDKLTAELGQRPRADRVARRDQVVGDRNHFAETWAEALHARQQRTEGP